LGLSAANEEERQNEELRIKKYDRTRDGNFMEG